MAANPACIRFIPQLSPYVDGELSPRERTHVEQHLAACRECTGRAADLRAEAALVRVGLEMAVDEVDFKDFSQRVLARVTPERPPLWERLKLSLSEMFLYQRGVMLSSLATAAVAALVAVPLLTRESPEAPVGYGAERMRVRAVSAAEGVKVAPVVLEDEQGNTIIWVVDPVLGQEGPDSDTGGGDPGGPTPGPDDGPDTSSSSHTDSNSDSMSTSDSSSESGSEGLSGGGPDGDSSMDSSSDSSGDSSMGGGDSGGGESASRPRPGGALKPAGRQPARPKGGAL